jgi:hypothetical protein
VSLRESQALFWRAITWPTGARDFASKADASTRSAIGGSFVETEAFSAIERLDVYAEAYFWRLSGVLSEQFPLVSYLVGEAAFHDLVTDFVLERPSIDHDVRKLGERFQEYVAHHPILERFPYASDVARVEWAMVAAIDGPDDPVLTVEALRNVPVQHWPRLRFELTRTTRILSSRWDVAAIWRARKDGVEADDAPKEMATTDRSLLVYRKELDVFHRLLPPGEASALTALARGETFAEACAEALRQRGGAVSADDVARGLIAWVASTLICRMAW